MRTIEWTSAFKRDYKRVRAAPRHKDIEFVLVEVGSLLAEDKPLKEKQHDHSLGGNWKEHRECHLKPDALLVYKKPDDRVLRFVRMGSHSELFSK